MLFFRMMGSEIDPVVVTNRLRATKKGQLQYNRHWNQPNRHIASRSNERNYDWYRLEPSQGYPGPPAVPCHVYYSTPQPGIPPEMYSFSPSLGSPIARLSPPNQRTVSPRHEVSVHSMAGSAYMTACQPPMMPPEMMRLPRRHVPSDGDSETSEESDSESVGRGVTPSDSLGRGLSPCESPEAETYDSGRAADEEALVAKSERLSLEEKKDVITTIPENVKFCRTFEAEKKMYEYDEERKRDNRKKVMSRIRLSEEKVRLVYLETVRKSNAASETKRQADFQIQEKLRLEEEEDKKRSLRRQESEKERVKERARAMMLRSQQIAQEEKRRDLERQEKHRITTEMLNQILAHERAIGETLPRIIALLGTPGIASKASVYGTRVRECTEGMQEIIAHIKTRPPEQEDVVKAENWLQQCNQVEKQLNELIEGGKKAEEEKQKQASMAARAVHSEEVVADCVYRDSLLKYTELIDKKTSTTNTLDQLKTDASFKALKFPLQKSVNLPLNTVSDVSVSHLKDKVTKLSSLLAGESVPLTNDKPVSTKQHPQAPLYVLNLLAMKIVKKAEGEVASKAEAGFPLAAVVVALWGKYPEFGELFLAHLYAACPFLVPYYLPQQEGQSYEDYYKALGYTYNEDGSIEKQDAYIRKMGGLARLFGAIVQTRPIGGKQPFYINRAWEWLAQILNLPPRPDITAAMVFEVLSICGWLLGSSYNMQFKKILHILCTDFFTRLKSVTPDDMMGPVTRLQAFLEKAVKDGQIKPPQGKLGAEFDRIA